MGKDVSGCITSILLRGKVVDSFFCFSLDDVKIILSAKSYATMEMTSQQCHIHVNADGTASSSVSPAVDSSAATIKACFSSLPGSPSQFSVILREVKSKEGKCKRLVELWKSERCYKWADVTEHHGEFIIHGERGRWLWVLSSRIVHQMSFLQTTMDLSLSIMTRFSTLPKEMHQRRRRTSPLERMENGQAPGTMHQVSESSQEG
jgi:hypothetical protein